MFSLLSNTVSIFSVGIPRSSLSNGSRGVR